MAPVSYEQQLRALPSALLRRAHRAGRRRTTSPTSCARSSQQALAGYIREHPGDISKPDSAFRRVPLNFPRPPEPPARNAQEWVARRVAADERLLWNKTCAECHEPAFARLRRGRRPPGFGATAAAGVRADHMTKRWMPRAAFDHTPHLMVTCRAATRRRRSTRTVRRAAAEPGRLRDLPRAAKGPRPAQGGREPLLRMPSVSRLAKSHPVTPSYSLTDFK